MQINHFGVDMKYLNTILLILALMFSNNLFGQSLEIVGEKNVDKTVDINEFWDIYFSAAIKNVGPGPVNVKLSTQVKKMTFGHSYDVCWDGLCSPPTTEDWTASNTYKLSPGSTTPENFFYAHYYSFYKSSDPTEGEGNIVYIFANESNTADKVEIDAKYKFVKGQTVFQLFGNPDINFSLENRNILISTTKYDRLTIEIFDINGNLALSQSVMNSYQNTLNLSAGSYFIRISSENKVLSKGKFILK